MCTLNLYFGQKYEKHRFLSIFTAIKIDVNSTGVDSETVLFVCLFGLRHYVPVDNFSVMSGRSHRFLGITSTFREVNVSCSRIQHGDLSEDRTPDISLQSDALPLGHCASQTVLFILPFIFPKLTSFFTPKSV